MPRGTSIWRLPFVLLAGLLFVAGCAHAPRHEEPILPPAAPAQHMTRAPPKHHAHRSWLAEGTASYYGPGLWGRKTANGERLRKKDMTAASRTLAFGTCLTVLNLDNGKRTQVRVNDRGPYAGNRLIDVSYAAGRALGMLEKGLARVRLFLCGKEPVDASAGGR